MKCDELKTYGMADPAIDEEYEMYKVTEVDEAIAELKEKLHDVDNQWNEQCKEIAILKAKLVVLQSFYDLHGNVDNYIDQLKAENEQLKAKLESVQASDYADSVDAGMRERRLKRALWLARAWSASNQYRMFCFSDHIGDLMNINGFIQRIKGCSNMRTAREWEYIWKNVERKCRAKAEQYK